MTNFNPIEWAQKGEARSNGAAGVPEVPGSSSSSARVPEAEGRSSSPARVPEVPGSSSSAARVPEAGATPISAVSAVSAVCAPCGNADSLQEFEQLVEAIEAAGVDITSDYNDWYKIAIAIANTFGEQGRSMFHRISKLYIDYNRNEAQKKYNQ